MPQAFKYFQLTASAIAACLVVSACGGGAAKGIRGQQYGWNINGVGQRHNEGGEEPRAAQYF